MESFKINLKNDLNQAGMDIVINKMLEYEDELRIFTNKTICNDIEVGEKLIFLRQVGGANSSVYYEEVSVLGIEDNVIRTTKLKTHRYQLHKGFRNARYVKNGDDGYYILKTIRKHDIFFQDLFASCGQEIYIKDYKDELLGTFSDISIPSQYTRKELVIDDFLTLSDKVETCGKGMKYLETYYYSFVPTVVNRNFLIVRDFKPQIMDRMAYFETQFNPFYYTKIELNEEGEPLYLDKYGRSVKTCILYEDAVWTTLNERQANEIGKIVYPKHVSITKVLKRNSYWTLNIGISDSVDYTALGSDEVFDEQYVNEIKETLIPEFIDMERVKYIPMTYDRDNDTYIHYMWKNTETDEIYYTKKWLDDRIPRGTEVELYDKENNPYLGVWKNGYIESDLGIFTKTLERERNDVNIAEEIEFNFHFRKRVVAMGGEMNTNSVQTKDNIYADGWYVDSNTEAEQWWNGMEYDKPNFNLNAFNKFIESSGEVSDLIGYLNFTDNDVFYHKQKVSKSFIRLSFYSSDDPLEQKLLFYSTIFLDGNTLYGKYMKQKNYLDDKKLWGKVRNRNSTVVMYEDGPSRVDTKIKVTNEYDRTKSSEGFNLYLFASDNNVKLDENGERTIYMKVEFNHAGNGKTIPMIMWPKIYWDNTKKEYITTNSYQPLTIDNFLKALYIPVKISYFNGKYIYYIPNAKNKEGKISLTLFEPKLDKEEETVNE